ncbi:3-deoxy-manno-octulosonate cytidylyltransferase [Planctomycetota bacterium]
MKIVAVIPARYASSRFPGKPLAEINGKPLVWWVYRRAIQVEEFDEVCVATDDDRIRTACEALGVSVVMTSTVHATGTDRLGEVAEKVEADLYVNVQGDEPLVKPDTMKKAIGVFIDTPELQVSCLMTKIVRTEDLDDPTVPKIVVNANNRAIYMSRLPAPFSKGGGEVARYKQVCVYGFTPEALRMFCGTERGPAERAEDIELLRFIENGVEVQMVEVEQDTVAVDTPEDLERVRELMKDETGE